MQPKKILVVTISTLVMCVALGSIASRFFPKYVSNRHVSETMGRTFAIEISKYLGSGSICLVILERPGRTQNDTFLEALKETPIRLETVEKILPDEMGFYGRGPFSKEAYLQILNAHPNVTAVVSLIGPPNDLDQIPLQPDRPKLIVFSPRTAQIEDLIRAHLLQMALVPKNPMGTEYEVLTEDSLRDK